MKLSIKKIFQRKEPKPATEMTEKQLPTETSHKDNSAEKELKHDTPSGCCGSCS